MRKSVIAFTLPAIAFLFAVTQAQAAPNLSGEWKLNVAKSDFGPIPAPDVMTRKIKHEEPSLAYSTYQKGQQGEVTTDIKYTTDGKECINKLPTGEAKGTAKWDGDKLLIESVRDFQGTELKSRDIWTLSEGGKVLTINSHLTAPQGEFDIKFVFDKQ